MNFAVRIGDDLNQWGIICGQQQSPDTDLSALTVEFFQENEMIDAGTSDPATIDDPFLSIARACERLSQHGLGFEPGQRIITGSVLVGRSVAGTGHWLAKFGDLGEVAANFV